MASKALAEIAKEVNISMNKNKRKGVKQTKKFVEKVKLLAISNYNCGAEYEYLSDY